MKETVDRFRDWDAAYVLGALSAEDRRDYEQHLATCADCASAVAQLAGIPGILSKLPSERAVAMLELPDAPAVEDAHLTGSRHTPGLVQQLAAATTRRRRRIRIMAGLAGAVVVALLTVGGVSLATSGAPAAQIVAMAPLQQHEITASLSITKKGWGTRFDWTCSYAGDAWEGVKTSYDLVVVERNGTSHTVASWTTAGPRASGLSASSAIATADIQRVEIRLSGSSTPLLSETL